MLSLEKKMDDEKLVTLSVQVRPLKCIPFPKIFSGKKESKPHKIIGEVYTMDNILVHTLEQVKFF
jgi:hypothetical protein